jgi:hypothetical protein
MWGLLLAGGVLFGLWVSVACFTDWQRNRLAIRLDERLSQMARLQAELADRRLELDHYRRLIADMEAGDFSFSI